MFTTNKDRIFLNDNTQSCAVCVAVVLPVLHLFKLLLLILPPCFCTSSPLRAFQRFMSIQRWSVLSAAVPKLILRLPSSVRLFDRWHVLTPKLVDDGWRLQLDSHRKLAICCNMLHRLRQRLLKGVEWEDDTLEN